MLKNLKISYKLTLMVVIPIIGILYFTIHSTLEKQKIVTQMDFLQEFSKLAVKSSSLIHELQKERGLSTGFLGSHGIEFWQELRAQRIKVDKVIKEFASVWKPFDVKTLDIKIQNQLNTIATNREIMDIRKRVNLLKISVTEILLDYTQMIDSLLEEINHLSKIITHAELSHQIMAYVNFLQAKEKLGLERATLSNVFSIGEGHFEQGMYNQFILLWGLEKNYINNFLFFATSSQKQIYQETMSMQIVEEFEKVIQVAIDKHFKLKWAAELQSHLGYGGLIHQFKNFVLRGEQKYIDAFHAQYASAFDIFAKYEKLPTVSPLDRKNIEILKNTFEKYKSHLAMAVEWKRQNKTVDEIDKLIKIDDLPAIQALNDLLKNSHLDIKPSYWWKIATGKINLFKKVEEQIAIDLTASAETLKQDAQLVFIFSLLFTGGTIVLTLFLTIFFARGITKPLKGLVNLANQISAGNREVGIHFHAKDEIGEVSETITDLLYSLCSSEELQKQKNKQLRQINEQLSQRNELIRQVFGRYLSDEIVNRLLDTDEGLVLGGEQREITILTSDIRGFTAQANSLPPEQVINIINCYLEEMVEVITKYHGTIDEFMGDGILVLFGAPIAQTDDPERACACAIAMQLAMEKVNERVKACGFAPLEMGIGINTGEVVVGNIGSEKRTKYGVIGNEVNLTYRIESYTIGGQILISESALKKVGDIVKIHSEQKIKPKGIKQTLNIYDVVGIAGKYNLHFRKEEEIFISLPQAIPIQYTVLEGKQIGEQVYQAHLIKLATKSVLIHSDVEPDLLPKRQQNLKMNFFLPNQSVASEDIYGKVLCHSVNEKNFCLHFTALPVEIKKQLQTLYKSLINWV